MRDPFARDAPGLRFFIPGSRSSARQPAHRVRGRTRGVFPASAEMYGVRYRWDEAAIPIPRQCGG